MDNISFQAKFNLTGIKNNKSRWQNVGKIFEEKTMKSPKDSFELYANKQQNQYCLTPKVSGCPTLASEIRFDSELVDNLMLKDDNFIAQKMVKAFNIIKRNAKPMQKAAEFSELMSKKYKSQVKNSDIFFDQFYSPVFELASINAKVAAAKDPVLKNMHFYI